MTHDRPHVTIYTDGGSKPNPGPGGWAAVLIAGDGATKKLSGAAPQTTNNRMELTAAIEALRALKRPCRVTLHTDSTYLKNGITQWLKQWIAHDWQRKGNQAVENEDLWRQLHEETQKHSIEWQWVKGHAGNHYNELVDRLATEAREQLTGNEASSHKAPPAADYAVALRIALPGGQPVGGWAARIETQADGTQHTVSGRARASSSNQLWLVAAREALRQLPEGVTVRVYAPDSYLIQGITRWIRGWRGRGWKTRDGSPVKNREAWEALDEETARRTVHWIQEGKTASPLAADLAKLAAEQARADE